MVPLDRQLRQDSQGRRGSRPEPGRPWLRRTATANAREKARRILAVDDDPAIRRLLGRALSSVYDVVVLVAHGDVALEEIRRHRPDLVILDLRMPVLDGWQLLERLELEGVDVPVILLSAETQRPWPESPLVRARHAKADGLDALLATCERVLSEASYPASALDS